MPEKHEHELVVEGVDVHPWGPTEVDEEAVLLSRGYVLNEESGIYEAAGYFDDPEDL